MTGLVEEIARAIVGELEPKELYYTSFEICGVEEAARAALSVILKRLEEPSKELDHAIWEASWDGEQYIPCADRLRILKALSRHLASEGEG